MPRTDLAYEKPSPVSQGLILCLGIAVVIMAGWLVSMIMLSDHSNDHSNTVAADEADIQPTTTRAREANVSPGPTRPGAAGRSNAADVEPSPWASTLDSTMPPATPAPARSALSRAYLREFAPGGEPDPTYATSSAAIGLPDARYRGNPVDELARRMDAFIEPDDTAADAIPLPLPKPRPVASIPVPRPRPRLDPEDVPSGSSQTLFELLVNRQR